MKLKIKTNPVVLVLFVLSPSTMSFLAKRSARLPKHVKRFQELVGKTNLWPRTLRRLILQEIHLNNKDRFTVIVFLLCNGVHRYAIETYFEDCFAFDSEAWRQIKWVIQKYPTSNWKQWNVAMNKSM